VLLALLLVGSAAYVNRDRSPETAAAGTPGGPVRLLLAVPAGSGSMALRPVEPDTLADLPGFDPIPVPLGLTVIDTAGLRAVGCLDLPVSDPALAPDGRRLLLWGASWDCTAGCAREGHGVYVVDPARLTQVAHLLPGNVATPRGFSPDGRYAYV